MKQLTQVEFDELEKAQKLLQKLTKASEKYGMVIHHNNGVYELSEPGCGCCEGGTLAAGSCLEEAIGQLNEGSN